MVDKGIDELIKWGQDHGAVIDSCIRFEKNGEKGVCAYSTRKIIEQPKTPQIKIPHDIIIKRELADQFFGKSKFNDADNVNAGLKLLLSKLKFDPDSTLVNEKDLKTKFAPFIELLPVGKETGSVFYWNSAELSLLNNTNLGGSFQAKLDALIKEWHSAIKTIEKVPEKDLTFYSTHSDLSRDELVTEILNVTSWTSFGAYLWSSIIFTSRAFPHDIIDSSCKAGQAILLPIIDLLNHNSSSKAEWKYEKEANDTGYFSLLSQDLLEEGQEVFNNYGAKGNEELLMGYGFAIDKNSSDSIALKVKLPYEVVKNAESFGFKIPRIEDYTQFAFTNDTKSSTEATDKDIEDGMLFFINKSSLIPDNLLLLFMYLSKTESEATPTLRSKLEALQKLRGALEHKKALLSEKLEIPGGVDSVVLNNAKVYRDGQKELYKSSLAEIKRTEKQLLQDHKGSMTTLKKIFKRDSKLQKIVEDCFGLDTYEGIEEEDVGHNVLFLWVILHGSIQCEEYQAPQYIIESYQKKQSKTYDDEYLGNFNALAEYLAEQLQENEIQKEVTAKNMVIASEVLQETSYTRISNDEIIVVDPVVI